MTQRRFPAAGAGRVAVGTSAALFRDRRRHDVFQRLGADQDAELARAALADAEQAGFEGLLSEQRETWAGEVHVVIDGDDELQRAIRFALFRAARRRWPTRRGRGLAACPATRTEGTCSDSDVFVLPFLAATHPQAARAMLEYRLRRLPAAREAAARRGRRGARFPWESAFDGLM